MLKMLLTSLLLCVSLNAQNPQYTLSLKNDIKTGADTFQFDIVISPKTAGESFKLASLQPVLLIDTAITDGVLSAGLVPDASELNSFQEPLSISVSGNEIYIKPRMVPGYENATLIESETVAARVWISTSGQFKNVSPNLNWKGAAQGNPYTKVNAYVNQLNTNITNEENHINSELQNQPMPVELSLFTISVQNNLVQLKWETKTEINNAGFDVERLENSEWKKIGFVEGHGTSNTLNNYSFTDKSIVNNSVLRYRLKQLDNDGSFTYSEEVEAAVTPEKFGLEQNYPNPFNPETTINCSLPNDAHVTLNIYNSLGEMVATVIDKVETAGSYSYRWSASEHSSGVYIYSLTARSVETGEVFSAVKKMSLIK